MTIYVSERTGCRIVAHRDGRGGLILPPIEQIWKAIDWADSDSEDADSDSQIEIP